MKVSFFIPLVLLWVMTGCTSSVRTVDPSGQEGITYQQLNRKVRGKVVKLKFRNGARVRVVGLTLDADSLSWVDRQANRVKHAATADLAELSMVKAGRGAIAGMFVGALIGAGVGAARAIQAGDDPASDPLGLTRSEKLEVWTPAHALYGALATTPIGAIIGQRVRYRFTPRSTMAYRVTE